MKIINKFLALVLGLSLFTGCGTLFKKEQPTQKILYSFLGAPGSGKGTLAEQCVKLLGFKVLSTGNLCREEIAAETEKGKMISEFSKQGKLVPDEVISEMVENWLAKQKDNTAPIILDGYPRTQKQAAMLTELLKNKLKDYQFRVISLEIPDEEIIHRISNRLVCENKKCQGTFNKTLMKDPNDLTCPNCKGKLIQREDDKEAVVRERLKVFEKNNAELINFYTEANIKIEKLSVSKISPEQAFENLKKMLENK